MQIQRLLSRSHMVDIDPKTGAPIVNTPFVSPEFAEFKSESSDESKEIKSEAPSEEVVISDRVQVYEPTEADKLAEIKVILSQSGADSQQQINTLARIKEVLGW